VPANFAGPLTIVTTADLGGLGNREGEPVTTTWERLPLVENVPMTAANAPTSVAWLWPWLVILGLLLFKDNRCAAAWLIWLPLICVTVGLQQAVVPLLLANHYILLEWEMVIATAFGLAVAWLLANRLRQKHRLLTSLSIWLAVMAGSGLVWVLKDDSALNFEVMVRGGAVLGMNAFVISVALLLAGWTVRNRFQLPLVYVRLAVLLLLLWGLILVLFALAHGWPLSLSGLVQPVVFLGMGDYLLLLPFLILSSASKFYRGRLKALLNMPETTLDFVVGRRVPPPTAQTPAASGGAAAPPPSK